MSKYYGHFCLFTAENVNNMAILAVLWPKKEFITQKTQKHPKFATDILFITRAPGIGVIHRMFNIECIFHH